MNYKVTLNVLGRAMIVGAMLFIAPLLVGLLYGEDCLMEFLIPLLILLVVGAPLSFIKDNDNAIHAKEGFVVVALVWIILSSIGSLPFVISGTIPSFADAFFETVSGFTTTGASILTDSALENMTANHKGLMFWRMFTHWIGGMGVLVFMLAILPTAHKGDIHIFRSESPGPSASKLVSKMRRTARILYAIYIGLSLIEVIFLLFSGMGVYESVLNTFSTAGTGGFALHAGSIAYYDSVYVEIVLAVFMFLFGVNFNIYYLILIKQSSKILKSDEFILYVAVTVISTLAIAFNLMTISFTFWEGLRYGFFQVTSISSTTGLSSINYDTFPAFTKAILLVLTIVGACAGSTGGGMKYARVLVLFKFGKAGIKKMVHPRSVYTVKLDGEPLSKETEDSIHSFFILWILIVIATTLLLCLDSFASDDFLTNFSATLACIGNVGPGFNLVGPACNYGGYSGLSKYLLSFVMLAGRLELFPILILLSPRTWKKSQ